MSLKVTIEYDKVFEPNEIVTRTVKYKETDRDEIILYKDTLPWDQVFKGTELLDEFMKKCYRDHFKFIKTENSL